VALAPPRPSPVNRARESEVELHKSDVALQAMICMLCNGVGVLLRRDDTEIQCEQCKGTGLVWLRVVPEDLRVN
jgi:hypothetical protein